MPLVEEHPRATGSRFAQELLTDWERNLAKFWQVCPTEILEKLAAVGAE